MGLRGWILSVSFSDSSVCLCYVGTDKACTLHLCTVSIVVIRATRLSCVLLLVKLQTRSVWLITVGAVQPQACSVLLSTVSKATSLFCVVEFWLLKYHRYCHKHIVTEYCVCGTNVKATNPDLCGWVLLAQPQTSSVWFCTVMLLQSQAWSNTVDTATVCGWV